MIASASAIHQDIGPHQKSSGSARVRPRIRKQRTRPMFDGLKTWLPRHLITYFESSETAAVPAKIHQPRMLHQSPCWVPGTRRMNATPLPVRSALAGHISTCCWRNVIPISSTAQVPSETRICAIERRKWKATCPRICSEMIVAARWSRGSRSFGRTIGYVVPRIATAAIGSSMRSPVLGRITISADGARTRSRDRRPRRLGGALARSRSSSPTPTASWSRRRRWTAQPRIRA